MKILVLQLARLGDIYLSWPSIRALHRQHPEAEIHCLVRERFAPALEGIGVPIKVHRLETKCILSPLLMDEDLKESLIRLENFAENLHQEQFDQIINLSFSPFSSYLVDVVKSDQSSVKGYCRQTDGYLAIPDDSSAYFYAQVGVQNWNRYHLGEVFAAVVGIDLTEEDWRGAIVPDCSHSLPEDYFVVQLSTSQEEKSFPDFKWRQVLSKSIQRSNHSFVIVGGPEDEDLARRTLAGLPTSNVVNLVGQTKISDLFSILKNSKGLLSCDSVGLHIASLTQTPCFTLSFSTVNFWETGPRSLGSRVIWAPEASLLDSERVVKEFGHWLQREPATHPSIERISNELIGYLPQFFNSTDFPWKLIQAIYTGESFPPLETRENQLAFARLNELAQLALDQLARIETNPKDDVSHQILSHIDLLLQQIHSKIPEVRPLVAWFETERLRMGPGEFQDVLNHTRGLFEKLAVISQLYVIKEESTEKEMVSHDNLDLVE